MDGNHLLLRMCVCACVQKKLVMNYLVVEGYREAAEHFVEESGTEAKVDLNTIEDRVAIRKVQYVRITCTYRTL